LSLLKEGALFHTDDDDDDDDEEARFEPSSSNSAEMDSSTRTSFGLLWIFVCNNLPIYLKVYILVNTSICMYSVSSVCMCLVPHNVCTVNVILHLWIVLMHFLTTITKCCGLNPYKAVQPVWPLKRVVTSVMTYE